MKATLDALDERLHGLLTRPCGRAARIVCAALTAFGFALVMATRTLALGHPMATAAATGRVRSVVRVRMGRTVTVGMAALCRFSAGSWLRPERRLNNPG